MKKNLKILYFLGPTIMGGATISFNNFLLEIVKKHDVVVAISRKFINYEFVNDLKLLGISIEYFDAEQSIYPKIRANKKTYDTLTYPYKLLRKIYSVVRTNREVQRIVERVQPDLIHTNIGVLYQVISVARKFRIPHVLHIREYQTKDFGWKIFPSKAYYQSALQQSHVITITKDIFNYFELDDHKNACVMYDGILSKDSVIFTPHKEKYFLCASRISEEKGIDSAVNAFERVSEQIPDYELWIAGGHATPQYQERLKKLIDSKACSRRIKLLGYRTDVVDLMRKATALIVASRFEGLGRMTVEAIFSGCLVIGRDSGGTKEVLELTKGGFLFQSDEQLADLMVHVAKLDEESYLSLIRASQQITIDNFSNENYCENLLKKYDKIVEHRLT